MKNRRDFNIPYYYQIVVKGNLDQESLDQFDGFLFSPRGKDRILMSGVVHDQAALHGTFSKICQLGLSILYVKREDWSEGTANGPIRQVLSNHLRSISY